MLAANVHANALDRSDLVTSDPGRRHAKYLHQIAVAYAPWVILLVGGAPSAKARRYCPPCTVRSWTQSGYLGSNRLHRTPIPVHWLAPSRRLFSRR